MDFYVYLHKKKTTGEVFYVGKGCGKRAWVESNRSDHWKRVRSKYGLIVEIVMDKLQEWYAYEVEAELTLKYGLNRDGGILVNQIHGGWGVLEGINNPNHDSTEYDFMNLNTNEKFQGTKYEFQQKFKIKSAPMFYTGKTSKGWIVYTGQTQEELDRLRFPSKEENNGNTDTTVYSFSHKDGRTFKGSRLSFIREFGFSPYHLFGTNPCKTQRGWYLEDNADVVKKSKRCQKIYRWVHDIYGEFLGTREQLETLYSLDTRPLFTTHKPKRTTKGWSLSPQQPEEFPCKN